MAQTSRPCAGCGSPVQRTRPTGPIPKYHAPECRPRCAVSGCDSPTHTGGWCGKHAARASAHGDPLAPLLRGKNDGPCSIEGCDRPSRKRGWCGSHYAMWHKYGEIRAWNYNWASEESCLVCGKAVGQYRSRKFCSAACVQVWRRHGGGPANPRCARCDCEIDLTPANSERRRRADIKLCPPCKRQTRTEATPRELAERDGAFCQLCGCDVDLGAVAPDKMRPSVDHILPRALGGSDAAENNQLTHLLCNQIKSSRTDPAEWGLMP